MWACQLVFVADEDDAGAAVVNDDDDDDDYDENDDDGNTQKGTQFCDACCDKGWSYNECRVHCPSTDITVTDNNRLCSVSSAAIGICDNWYEKKYVTLGVGDFDVSFNGGISFVNATSVPTLSAAEPDVVEVEVLVPAAKNGSSKVSVFVDPVVVFVAGLTCHRWFCYAIYVQQLSLGRF